MMHLSIPQELSNIPVVLLIIALSIVLWIAWKRWRTTTSSNSQWVQRISKLLQETKQNEAIYLQEWGERIKHLKEEMKFPVIRHQTHSHDDVHSATTDKTTED